MIKIINWFLIILIRGYQLVISPMLSPNCRFAPSCSQYAIDGIQTSGIRAIPTIIKRITRCHPWGGFGFDPYPTAKSVKMKKTQSKALK